MTEPHDQHGQDEQHGQPREPARPQVGPHEPTWEDLTGAVAGAAFRVDEMATEGFGASAASAVAVSILDAAIRAVRQRRRQGTNRPPDAPLDPAVFDPQALRDLLEFLQHARRGLLTAEEIVQEAVMWEKLLQAGWPADASDIVTVLRAVDLLSDVPATGEDPPPLTEVEPANDLERAMAAAVADEAARPALWQAIHDGEVVLPVVAYELVRPEGANFQFLSVPYSDTPLVLGFATEERFRALLPPGSEVSLVEPPGRHLPRIWPAGHWLMINPGYANNVVLSPWEIEGLPHGGRAELPNPRAVQLEAPDEDDPRREVLARAVTRTPQVGRVAWARVRPARAPSHAPWQDVLVVSASPPDQDEARSTEAGETAAVQALVSALPPSAFAKAIVVGRQVDLEHPFIEAAVTAARHLDP
jgi:hypothetical protein